MAIATFDQAAAGMRPGSMIAKAITATLVAGRPASLWSLAGAPGAGGFDTTLNGAALTGPVAGQIPRTNPASGNSYLARLQAAATQGGTLMLLDRLWHNGGYTITSTAAQNTTFPGLPSRCPTSSSDWTPSANGYGALLALEVSAACGAAAPTITCGYTNEAGTAGRTGTNILATVNSPAIGATHFIGLQAGDNGVRSLQSMTLSASWVSGTVNMVIYRPIAMLELPGALIPNAIDWLTGGGQRIYDGAVPWLVFVPNTTTASMITGQYVETQG